MIKSLQIFIETAFRVNKFSEHLPEQDTIIHKMLLFFGIKNFAESVHTARRGV
ncbi:MAG: hypothetical protein LBF80_01055 [Spirochaetaceae bacterium]|jgi:hypothetical protein|nr:hypothetical protein [Spirochaetaceae bacterium]